jgi:tetratricopeptide (TPR) repeat protein
MMRGIGRAPALTGLTAVLLIAAGLVRAPGAAARPILWEQIADPQRDRVDRLLERARQLMTDSAAPSAAPTADPARARPADPPDNLARAEDLLREAARLAPQDFAVMFSLGEVQSLRGRGREATASFERAEPLARLPGQRSVCWFRLGIERSKLGRYREAVASYDQQLALGEGDATVYSNVAELLMALGRLGEAAERYRDAIRIDERAGDRRGREQGLAFSYYGLGVALDRDRQEAASREAIGRAVALDPNSSLLRLAQQPGADVFFIPDGDVFYYLGLAGESVGNRDDAGAAFQEYLARQPHSPWLARVRAHLEALRPSRAASRVAAGAPGLPGASLPGSSGPAPAPTSRWRVAAVATVLAQGPIPAPAIDAALKQRPPGWELCFAPYPPPRGHDPVRITVEIELDANGAVTRATSKLPPPFAGSAVAACIETTLRARLVVSRPTRARSTTARIEVLLASGDAGGV